MWLFSLCFLLGDLYLQQFALLPSPLLLISLMCLGLFSWLILRKYIPYSFMFFAFIIGFVWSAWYAHSLLSWSLAKELEGQPITITGYISSVPVSDQFGEHFIFRIKKLTYQNKIDNINVLIKLSDKHIDNVYKVGDEWQLFVRLKRTHSTQNPGTFDMEARYLQLGLRAQGYIVVNQQNKWLRQSWHNPIDQLRQRLKQKIEPYLPNTPEAPWLLALMIGERDGIAQGDWEVLRNTGTNHLMAIGGLHIGMIAGIFYAITSWIWRLFPYLLLVYPAKDVGAFIALIVAWIYSALAGFSLPTKRACIMLCCFMLSSLCKWKINSWHVWSIALLIVLMLNPLDVLTESFWLSFATIALIIYTMEGRLRITGWWWKYGRVQWVIALGLIPFSLCLFQQCSLISFVANTIAIPWLTLTILPLCFLSCIFLLFLPAAGSFLLIVADKSLSLLWKMLTFLSHLPVAVWHQVIPTDFVMSITLISVCLLLSPRGFPIKWFGFIGFMPFILFKPNKPAMGDMWMTLLDVGQGLSVIIQTKHHVLIYDTGAKFITGLDMGESVLLPYLYSLGIHQVDMLVVSHGDNDHIGGTSALLKGQKVLVIKTSVPEKIPSAHYCLAGEKWQWDNINFAFIYPTSNDLSLNNDSSCVLKVDNGKQKILLTGDIEKHAEKLLLKRTPLDLNADILVAPHHGSKTSGSIAFINAVHPQFVLYATGYRNRYHFPHPTVVANYQAIKSQQFNTAETGAIEFKLIKDHPIQLLLLYREQHKRYWYDE